MVDFSLPVLPSAKSQSLGLFLVMDHLLAGISLFSLLSLPKNRSRLCVTWRGLHQKRYACTLQTSMHKCTFCVLHFTLSRGRTLKTDLRSPRRLPLRKWRDISGYRPLRVASGMHFNVGRSSPTCVPRLCRRCREHIAQDKPVYGISRYFKNFDT